MSLPQWLEGLSFSPLFLEDGWEQVVELRAPCVSCDIAAALDPAMLSMYE